VCLGAQAKAANEQARRNYQYELQKREANWMQTLSLTNVERIEYEQGTNARTLQARNIWSDIQAKHGDMIDEAMQQDQTAWKEYLQKNTGDTLAASGVTGKSADRIASLDLAEYLKSSSDRARAVSNNSKEMNRQGFAAAGKIASQQKQAWMDQQFIKMPDIAPPQPVMQDVGAAAFMDALSIGTSILGTAGNLGWKPFPE
tara:strand:- start:6950 stop:7552 length:603 start_codon:yes stop_codon:yes gene_type:complete